MQQQEGYLYKRGDVVKKWNLRYFVLYTTPQASIVYYRKVGESPANTLRLTGATVTVSGTVKGGSLFPFTLEASGERYELAATTQQDRRRWVEQLMQASARGSPSVSITEGVSNGHLLAPSPLGLRVSLDQAELSVNGSPPASPSGCRHTAGQEALGSFGQPSKLRRVALDFSSPQLSPQRGAARTGTPPAAAAGLRSPPLDGRTGSGVGTAASGGGGDSPGLGQSLRSPSGQFRRSSLLGAISSSIRNVIVPPIPSDVASSMSDDSHESGLTAFSAYTANLRPLKGPGTPSAAGLLNPATGSSLAAESLLEQFDRAQQYVARHKEDFSAERLESLQVWAEAARCGSKRGSDSRLAAAAMYVLQVTQGNALWASEHDTAFISPEAMIRDVQRCPSLRCLMDLKDCLDFCSTSWVSLFCQLGGASLLLQALDAHAEASGDGGGEAREALQVSLQCVHALMSGAAGMRGMLGVDACVPRMAALLCGRLRNRQPHAADAAKLVVEMLIKLCLFSAEGYRLAIKGLLGEASIADPSSAAPEQPGTAKPAAQSSKPPPSPPPPPPPRTARAAGPRAPPPPPPPPPSPLQRPSRPAQTSTPTGIPGDAGHPLASPEDPLQGGNAQEPSLKQPDAAHITSERSVHGMTEPCTSLVALLRMDAVGGSADLELCDHIISFINAALTSPEAQSNLPLRKRFVNALLDRGLLNVLADIYGLLDPYMNASIDVLRANVKDVIVVPKPAAAAAAPPAAPKAPARSVPPPPPPPRGRKGTPVRPPPPLAKPRVEAGPRPSRKMKSFFWDKLPDNRVAGTFWAANPPAYSSLNTQEVEELFQAMQLRKAPVAKAAAVKQLAVLELKRATAIGIRMAGLKVHWSRAAEAVMRLDPELLAGADDARTVLACVPTAEERAMLGAFLASGGNAEALSDAERFCLDLMKVPRNEERLATFAASFEAAAQLREAAAALAGHRAAHAELRSSRCFGAALAAALALGNFLNHGSRLGQAVGFRLKNLPKLQDTRSQDGRMTLLRYVAKQLCPAHPLLCEEVPHVVSPALQISLSEVAEVVERVSAAVADIAREAERTPPGARLVLQVLAHNGGERVAARLLPDNYHDTMTTSLLELRARLEEVKGTLRAARDSFSELVAYFGENAAAFASDGDFWRDVTAFVHALSRAQREILQQQLERQRRDARQQKQGAHQTPGKTAATAARASDCSQSVPASTTPNKLASQPRIGGDARVQPSATDQLDSHAQIPGIELHQNGCSVLSASPLAGLGAVADQEMSSLHSVKSGGSSHCPSKLRERVGGDSLIDSAEDLEHLLSQMVGRADSLPGSVLVHARAGSGMHFQRPGC